MKIFKILFLATFFLGCNTTGWTSKPVEHDGAVSPKMTAVTAQAASAEQKQPVRKMGLKPTSEKTLKEIKSHKKSHALRAPAPSTGPLPKAVDLSRYCKVMNQGGLGSCTSFALAGQMYMRQAMQLEAKGKTLEKIHAKQESVSHLFIYWEERNMEGTVNEDAGASIGDGILVMYKKGAPREKFWPYDDSTYSIEKNGVPKFMQQPSLEAYANAKENKDIDGISNDLILPNGSKYDINVLKRAIFDKQPLSLGITLFDSFQSENVAKTGIIPLPKKGENEIGGHAVLCVGYDDTKNWFKFANSWDVSWGDKGFFYLPYDYFKSKWVSEVWKMGTVTVQNIPLRLNHFALNDNNDVDEKKKESEK